MYPGMRMYGSGMTPGAANGMGPGTSNGMAPGTGAMVGGPGTTGYYPGFNMQGYDQQQQQQQQQQYFNNYGFNQQQQCDFQQFQQQQQQQQQQYPGWEQQDPQQQQHQSWNMEWSWNRNQGGQYPGQDKDRKPTAGQTPAATAAAGQTESSTAYQRTLQYVKNCQSWSSPEYPAAPAQDPKEAKLKRSPTEAQVMPPPSIPQMPAPHVHANGMSNGMQPMSGMPMNGMSGMMVKQDNMVLGDMNSSMNQLMEENRYLQMLH